MHLFLESVNKDGWEESFPLQDANDEGEYNHVKHDQCVNDGKVQYALNAIENTSNHHEYTSEESGNSKGQGAFFCHCLNFAKHVDIASSPLKPLLGALWVVWNITLVLIHFFLSL
mmetsp:Transcript_18026/g.26904  ORF Transcript_18026/g.26904 Transcript_18026/m.26904 type:complete len:115 (-) Transcript_18026:132-476(-)